MIFICANCDDAFEIPDELIGDNEINPLEILCDDCDDDDWGDESEWDDDDDDDWDEL